MIGPFIVGNAQSCECAGAHIADKPDHRGWFYRVVAPDSELAVLEMGAPFVRNWFANVVSGDLGMSQWRLPSAPRFAMVILHSTLGGCASITEALRAAHGALQPGGIAALAGVNRLRVPIARGAGAARPTATAWGYSHAARAAGFAEVSLYGAQPSLDDPVDVFSFAPASSRAFFQHEALARKSSGRDRFASARTLLARAGLAPYLHPFFVVIARKC
jgi:hypothetical protein